MNPSQQYPIPHAQVAARVIDNEAVIVLSESGEVEILNEVGSRIWELMDGTRTLEAIAQTLAEEFEVTAEQAQADLAEFVEQLVQQRVIVLADRPAT